MPKTIDQIKPHPGISTGAIEEAKRLNRTTGISILDTTLGGGLPSGSVVYVSADAKSMAEVFLYQFAQARKTYYFENERRPSYVRQDIKNLGFDTSSITFADIYGEYYMTPREEMVDTVGNEFADAKIVEFTEYNLKNIMAEAEEDINIIFDTFSFYLSLKINFGRIKRLVNLIYETTKNLNCISLLYGLKNTHEKSIENEILKSCDVIFDIALEKNSNRMANYLSIPKIRGMAPITNNIRFKIVNGIEIDTTTDIA